VNASTWKNYLHVHWLIKCIPKVLVVGCRNPNFGLATKARGCKVVSHKGSLGVMPHAPRSARECEGINPHTPKGIPILGVGVLMESRMFKEQLQG